MNLYTTVLQQPFMSWLLNDKENKLLLWLSFSIITISFTWLKIIYPYPNFMPPDSFSYLRAAYENEFINMWPIGYSRFIRLISSFTSSHIVLVTLQYLLLIASVCYFLYSFRYLFSPRKWLFRLIWIVSICNPLLPHIANFVSSDCLFAVLSLIWFTQLFWIIYRPSQKLLLIHAVVLLLAFMVRFTAIWYPFVSIGLIAFTHMPWKIKWSGIGAIVLLLLAFISRTGYEYKLKTNTLQYSAFGNWQVAANALYGYAYTEYLDSTSKLPIQFRELHAIVNRHMDSIRRHINRADDKPGIYYLWDFKSPLRIYLKQQTKKGPIHKAYFEKWATVGPLYGAYGKWLILHHPLPFFQHYVWPNLLSYYSPPTFFMGYYNYGNPTVDSIAVKWFDWKNNQLPTRAKDRQIHILSSFPFIISILNPLFFVSFLVFVFSKRFRTSSPHLKKIIGCMFFIWLANALFSAFSAPNELRYQIFPIVITFPFTAFFIQQIIESLLLPSPPIIKPSFLDLPGHVHETNRPGRT